MTTRLVYPVEGRFLADVPAVPHECTDKRCVESGAFTLQPPPKAGEPTTETPETPGSLDSADKE